MATKIEEIIPYCWKYKLCIEQCNDEENETWFIYSFEESKLIERKYKEMNKNEKIEFYLNEKKKRNKICINNKLTFNNMYQETVTNSIINRSEIKRFQRFESEIIEIDNDYQGKIKLLPPQKTDYIIFMFYSLKFHKNKLKKGLKVSFEIDENSLFATNIKLLNDKYDKSLSQKRKINHNNNNNKKKKVKSTYLNIFEYI